MTRRFPFLFPLLLALSACALPRAEIPHAATAAGPTLTATAVPSPTVAPSATPSLNESLLLGDRALLNGDWAAAAAHYQAALAAGAEPERAAFFLARTMYHAADLAGARSMLESLIGGYPAGAFAGRAQLLLGEVAASQADWAASVAAYQNFLLLAPGLLNDFVQERVGDSSLAGGWTDQAVQAYAAAADASNPANRLRLLEKEADALSGAKQAEAAIPIYEEVLAGVTSTYAKARLQRKIGGALIALGRAEEGYARYEAALEYPAAYDAFLCLSELIYAGRSVDNLIRGIVDYYAGVHDTALVVLTDYLAADPAEPAKALYFRGLAARALDRPGEAAADFEAAAALGLETGFWDSALFELAYTRWAWLDDTAGAVSILAGLADAIPAHPRSPEALYTAARIAERGGELTLAAQLWTRMAQDYPADSGAAEARHLAGIALYRLGDYAGAEAAWAAGASSGDGWTRSRALFWTSKARGMRGDPEGSRSALEQAAAASPTDYYSERAADILAGNRAFSRSFEINLAFDLDAEYLQAEAWVQSVFASDQPIEQRYAGVKNDPRLARGGVLWDIGLYDEARAEFDGLWFSAANDPAGSLYLSRRFEAIGYYPGATQAARQVLDAAGLNDAQTLAAPAYFNHVRFGPYFMDLIVPQAARFSLHPLLLFGLVRQESLFGISAASAANAHGLMQLIPSTAEAVAAELGMAGLTVGDLYRPVINVQLGAAYLAAQRDSFGGSLFQALAAYNAGPGSASFWRDLAGGDDDLFVEVIRYDETRNYVRRVYENYVIYSDLYQAG
ncbi:MAG: lytic transglycosylase domain-containing protein [Anaerolineales bacterium]|nr:lytic transglycosylase domain-containing protein [Anaerolineales bacterium]